MSFRTGIVFDERLLHHRIEQQTHENPGRLRGLYQRLTEVQHLGRYQRVKPRSATSEEIEAVHSSLYLEQLRRYALYENPFAYDKDTYLMDETIYAAGLAAGGCIELADRIMAGSLENGFALIRPPGHHAEPGRGMGFCVFNNIAITAAHLLKHHNLRRILIVDFDVHHCNGTQDCFYETDQVMTVSVHQRDMFPFTGGSDESGEGRGRGYTLNLPVYSGFSDREYTYLFGRVLQEVTEQYMPQFILVSAGYDGHVDETISAIRLSTGWYATVSAMLRFFAREVCDNRLLFILEGGYNPASLEDSVLASLESLAASDIPRVGIFPVERVEKVIANHPLRKFWNL